MLAGQPGEDDIRLRSHATLVLGGEAVESGPRRRMKDFLQAWREVTAAQAAGEGAGDDTPRSPRAGDIARSETQAL